MQFHKSIRHFLSILLIAALLCALIIPAVSATGNDRGEELLPSEDGMVRSVNSNIVIDDNASGGYEGDYVVIYNPSTSYSTSYSTGNMSGLIETNVNANVQADAQAQRLAADESGFPEARSLRRSDLQGAGSFLG